MRLLILITFCFLFQNPIYAKNKPSVEELRALFPQYKNLHVSNDRPADFKAHPCSQGNCTVAAAVGVEEVISKGGKTELNKDIDGDGLVDYVFVGQWDGKQNICEDSRGAYMLGVLRRTEHGWKVLHDRHTGDNCVLSAFLAETEMGFYTYVLEARFTCDDEKLEKYEITWDKTKKALAVPVSGSQLHPFPRNWNCGE